MKLDTHLDGIFETTITEEDFFELSITQETNGSVDGGYTFEVEEFTVHLNKAGAYTLMKELLVYLEKE